MRYQKIACAINDLAADFFKLIEYFSEFSEDFYLYVYPERGKTTPAVFRHYHEGKLIWEKKYSWYQGKNKVIILGVQYFYFLYFLKKLRIRKTYFIIHELHFAFFNSLVTLFTKNKPVLWLGDGCPNRYQSLSILFLDYLSRFYIHRAEHIYFASSKNNHLSWNGFQSIKDKLVIPLGVSDAPALKNQISNLFGFIGNLREGLGLELIFDTARVKKNFHLEIVGDGKYRKDLEKLAKEYELGERVKFLGYLEYPQMMKTASRWQLAFATYFPSNTNYTYYADPGKVKLYMELELPVIMTDITYIVKEIQYFKAGEIVKYKSADVVSAIDKIQGNYPDYLQGIRKLKKQYFYKDIYKEGFSALEKRL